MFRRLLERRKDEEGFTLIELMVVVLIIGILVAIALPTFLGARNRANDKAAQSGLRNGLVAAKTCFTDADTYVGCNDTTLATIETALSFQPANTVSTGPGEISVSAVSATVWKAAALSKSQTCFSIADNAGATGGGTYYGKTIAAASCRASAATFVVAAPPTGNTSSSSW